MGLATPPQCYSAKLVDFDMQPVISFVDNSSSFQQVFNPSWIVSSAHQAQSGLIIRTQNCSLNVGDKCAGCHGSDGKASVLTFAPLLNNDNHSSPQFGKISAESVVFGPHDSTDDYGTEDPRVAFDPRTGIYYMLYTCYNSGKAKPQPPVTMCLASTTDPTKISAWKRWGPLGFGQGSKSGALLIRETGKHMLYWGAGTIHITQSGDNITHWPSPGVPFITETLWGNPNVEAGPPPMKLSTGDYVFFHNSWNKEFPEPPGYQPAWVILNGSNLTQIIARAPEPLWSPQKTPWMEGKAPYTCNVANVAFLEAAHPTDKKDQFRVYFGGSDAVIGTAVVEINAEKAIQCA